MFQIHSLTSKLPLTYGYRFTDDYGTMQSREEKTDPNGSKTGSYSFVDAAGLYRRVEYVADHHGFRATVTTNEPGTISVDPAHVRMLTDNKRISLGGINHATGIAPQLEYSSHIFSRYNLTDDYDVDRHLANPVHSVGIAPKPVFSTNPMIEPVRSEIGNENIYNTNSYKGTPVAFSPEITSLLQQLEDPAPVVYGNTKNLNSNKYFNEPSFNPDYVYDDKISNTEYKKKVPTRYPRRKNRNSRVRTKKGHVLRIHIPKGYEDRHDLPLYRDK